MATLENLFLWFFIYCVIGWIWEVIVCSVPAKKFVNRGFLNGPYCPIYGAGALLVITFLRDIENPLLLFLAGGAMTCTLEYITSWVMEKLFHARWWDYSNNRMNINGRVCLMGFAAFGALSVVVLKFVHPTVARLTGALAPLALSIISLALFTLMLTDTVYTITRFSGFNAKLKELNEKLTSSLAHASDQRKIVFLDLQKRSKPSSPYSDVFKRLNFQERRLIKAFPKMRSTRYNEAMEKLKKYVLKKSEESSHRERKHDKKGA